MNIFKEIEFNCPMEYKLLQDPIGMEFFRDVGDRFIHINKVKVALVHAQSKNSIFLTVSLVVAST